MYSFLFLKNVDRLFFFSSACTMIFKWKLLSFVQSTLGSYSGSHFLSVIILKLPVCRSVHMNAGVHGGRPEGIWSGDRVKAIRASWRGYMELNCKNRMCCWSLSVLSSPFQFAFWGPLNPPTFVFLLIEIEYMSFELFLP